MLLPKLPQMHRSISVPISLFSFFLLRELSLAEADTPHVNPAGQ
jgi:hypothetical protein